METKM
jgi:hypothetical protein